MKISAQRISSSIYDLCLEANRNLPKDVAEALARARREEESPLGKEILIQLEENARIAREEQVPICQDTGMVVVFADLGHDVQIEGDLYDAINSGVAQAYQEGYLRKSIVGHPLDRVNTNNNTPAVVHLNLVPGSKLRLVVAPKGFGSENMGGVAMLKPAQGKEGVVDFVVSVIDRAGANPCPPIIVGVGIGGTMEYAAFLAKRALLREIGSSACHPLDQELEQVLLERINSLGIGPQGYGGRQTALAVHVESYPTHIAGLPVAVNINCHAARHAETVLEGE